MRALWLSLLFVLPAAAQEPLVVLSPHQRGGRLYKGQLHCHSTASDGHQSPAELFAAYGRAGYAFVCLSDHLARTPDPHVDGVTWIPASEVHTKAAELGDTWGGHHIGALGIQSVPADWDRSSVQAVLARIGAEGGLAMANHPRLRNHWSAELLASARPLQLISIFNTKGFRAANQKLQGAGSLLYATQFQWDRLLREGGRLWGVAADDCHDVTDPEQFDVGWVRVRAASARAEDLLAALRRGDVYACRGPGGVAPDLRVWVERDAGGTWWAVARSETPGVTLRWISAQGEEEQPGPLFRQRVDPQAGYLRAEAHDGQQRDRVSYAQPLQVVRGARLATRHRGERWEIELQDAAGHPVAPDQDLSLRLGDAPLRLPAGTARLVLPPQARAGQRVVPDPRSGWPQVVLQ